MCSDTRQNKTFSWIQSELGKTNSQLIDGSKIKSVNLHACQKYSNCYNFRFSAYIIRIRGVFSYKTKSV